MATDLIQAAMRSIRVKSDTSREEISELVSSCDSDLKMKGIYVTDKADPLYIQAVKLYCKAHYGYDDDVERFAVAYTALTDSMALCGDYANKDVVG